MILAGKTFPNLFLARPDGTSFELVDFRKREFVLLLFMKTAQPDVMALITRFQEEAKLFEWLHTRLIAVFPDRALVPTPWPAPGYGACLHAEILPEGMAWDQGYLIDKQGGLLCVYPEPHFLSAVRLEQDVMYYDRGLC